MNEVFERIKRMLTGTWIKDVRGWDPKLADHFEQERIEKPMPRVIFANKDECHLALPANLSKPSTFFEYHLVGKVLLTPNPPTAIFEDIP